MLQHDIKAHLRAERSFLCIFGHALLNPGSVLSRDLLKLLLSQWLGRLGLWRHISTFGDCWPVTDLLQPGLEIREFLNINTSPG